MVNLFLLFFSAIAACICFIVSVYIGGQTHALHEEKWEKEVFYFSDIAFDKGIAILGLIFVSWVCIGIFEILEWIIFKRFFSLINSLLMLWSLRYYTDRPSFLSNVLIRNTTIVAAIFLFLFLVIISGGNDIPKYIPILDFMLSIITIGLISLSLWTSFNPKRGMKAMRSIVALLFLCCLYTQVVELAYEGKAPELKAFLETAFAKVPDSFFQPQSPQADTRSLTNTHISIESKNEALRSIGRLLYRPLFLLCVLMLSLTWLRKIESETESNAGDVLAEVAFSHSLPIKQAPTHNTLSISISADSIDFSLYIHEPAFTQTAKIARFPKSISLPYFYLYLLARCVIEKQGICRQYFSNTNEFDKIKQLVGNLFTLDNDNWIEVNEGILTLKSIDIQITQENQNKIEQIFRESPKVQDKLKVIFHAADEKAQSLIAAFKP